MEVKVNYFNMRNSLEGQHLEKMPPFFLLQINPKLCYFINEYACLWLDLLPIFENLPNNCGGALHGRPFHRRRPLHGRDRHQNQTVDQKLNSSGEKSMATPPSSY